MIIGIPRLFALSLVLVISAQGDDLLERVRKLEASGDSLAARTLLSEAVKASPRDVHALSYYADFLDRYGDSACRPTYRKLLAALGGTGDAQKRATVARRLVALDLLAGDYESASRTAQEYRATSGNELILPLPSLANSPRKACWQRLPAT
jgi:hypothetical protein